MAPAPAPVDIPDPDEALQAAIAASRDQVLEDLERLQRRLAVLNQMAEMAEMLEEGASVEELATGAPAAHQRVEIPAQVLEDLVAVPGPLAVEPEDDDDDDVDETDDERRQRLDVVRQRLHPMSEQELTTILHGGADPEELQVAREELDLRLRRQLAAEPPPSPTGHRPGSAPTMVRAYFAEHPGEWLSTSAVAAAVDLANPTVRVAAVTLRKEGVLEHNGEKTTASRYRYVGPSASAVDEPANGTVYPDPAGDHPTLADQEQAVQQQPPPSESPTPANVPDRVRFTPPLPREGAKSSVPRPPAPAMSARVRRELADEISDIDQRRTNRRLGIAPPPAGADDAKGGTVQGRILQLLQSHGKTSAGAMTAQLGLTMAQLGPALKVLAEDGDIRTAAHPRGDNPRDMVWEMT